MQSLPHCLADWDEVCVVTHDAFAVWDLGGSIIGSMTVEYQRLIITSPLGNYSFTKALSNVEFRLTQSWGSVLHSSAPPSHWRGSGTFEATFHPFAAQASFIDPFHPRLRQAGTIMMTMAWPSVTSSSFALWSLNGRFRSLNGAVAGTMPPGTSHAIFNVVG